MMCFQPITVNFNTENFFHIYINRFDIICRTRYRYVVNDIVLYVKNQLLLVHIAYFCKCIIDKSATNP